MKVMIVDDQSSMRRLLREALASAADEIVECSSGEEAISRYAATHPDWVMMDYRMEPLDGIDTTRRIREAHPHARIVIVSNWDEPELREAASAAGAIAYLPKDELSRLPALISKDPLHE